jgi:transposase
MKGRCYSKKFKGYNSYGGRGIKVCNEWLNDFMAFHDWAYSNGYKEEVLPNGRNKWTLDRINVNGDYCPENCRWITVQEQAFNRRENRLITYNGKTQTITEWSKELKIHRNTLYRRLNSNYSIEKAFTTPVKEKKTEEQIVKEKIEIIKYIKKGMKNKEISEKLGLSSWFVKETRKKYNKEQNNDTN